MKFYKKKIITRGDEVPYLVRYSLFSCRWFAIKIHNILISDDDCLHDHPWAFLSIILSGSYIEHTVLKSKGINVLSLDGRKEPLEYDIQKIYKSGNILYRRADWKHKLELSKPMWTFVITFKKVKDWGFYTSNGFINWRNYRSSGERCE